MNPDNDSPFGYCDTCGQHRRLNGATTCWRCQDKAEKEIKEKKRARLKAAIVFDKGWIELEHGGHMRKEMVVE